MKRAGMIAVAGAVGVFAGGTRADDVSWRTPGGAPIKARAAAPDDDKVPAAPQWRPARANDPSWAPARGITPQPPAPLPLPEPVTAPPMPDPTGYAVPAPVKAFQLPTPDQPQPPQAPQPTPPLTLPKTTKPEPAPPPRAAPPQALPTPRPMADERKEPGKPAAVLAAPVAATDVWGAYGPCDAKKGTSAVPVRHGTYGSPDLRLSRDYHVLDCLARPITGESERLILNDQEAAADRYFVQTEYLLWWTRQAQVPALATTASNQLFGFIGQPGTTPLLGPGGFGGTFQDGFRVRAGGWLNECNTCGVDASYFFLGERTDRRGFSTPQFPTILRPIFSPNFNAEFGELVSFPGLSSGTLDVTQSSELWGADVNLKKALVCGCDRRLAAFAGYRYLNLHETLTVRESLTAGPDAPDPEGTRITVVDRFDTRNQFHGGQLGITGERRWGRVALDGRASLALGVTHQVVNITGGQVRTPPGGQPETFTGGLLAVGPNLGRFSRDRFAVVPEATLNLGYYLTPNLKAYVGYNFLYWSNVIRPGDQIDRVVDLTFVPNAPPVPFSGQNRPQPTFRQTDFWAQGIQFGLEFRW